MKDHLKIKALGFTARVIFPPRAGLTPRVSFTPGAGFTLGAGFTSKNLFQRDTLELVLGLGKPGPILESIFLKPKVSQILYESVLTIWEIWTPPLVWLF